LTAERIRRIIKGVPKAKDEALRKGLGGSFSFIEVGNPMQLESLLKGDKLPSYEDLAGYVFYTATGEEFDSRAIKRKTYFIGESSRYDVYLLYEPDMNYLKNTALTLVFVAPVRSTVRSIVPSSSLTEALEAVNPR